MRQLLIPKYERFDFNQPLKEIENKTVNQLIEDISKLFDDYLRNLNIFATTKSALMGPVGKTLEQARVKGLDAEFLKGYGISIHKNTIKVPLSVDVLKPFESGIDLLSVLLQKVPRHLRPKIIEIISYKIYYRREKANVEFWENWRKDFKDFLNKKYKNIESLIKECKLEELQKKREIKDFQSIIQLPKKLRTTELQIVVDEFTRLRKEIILEEEEAEV
jgi:hypothetical protein